VNTEKAIIEPFGTGRSAARLLYDFAVMASLMNPAMADRPVLDFGAGSGWISEFCARMGLQVVAFDIHGDLQACLEGRVGADRRIDPGKLSYTHGDGHSMVFDAATFGHLLCYDTLHHMHDYPGVFTEFFRVLCPGGRAIFVEPGAHHSSSPETIAFLTEQKQHDPDWIERDVVLEEINSIALAAGFVRGIQVVPTPHPEDLQSFSLTEWTEFRSGSWLRRSSVRERFDDHLARINYFDRVIFYVDKPT
jgi:SAM-dependent methyltransferase